MYGMICKIPLTVRKISSQSVSLAQYVVLCVHLPVCYLYRWRVTSPVIVHRRLTVSDSTNGFLEILPNILARQLSLGQNLAIL